MTIVHIYLLSNNNEREHTQHFDFRRTHINSELTYDTKISAGRLISDSANLCPVVSLAACRPERIRGASAHFIVC